MDLDSKVIVFMGDSITEFWQRESDFFSKNSNFINKGVSGQTTTQMLHRFQKDVIDLNPSTVIVLAGINDIAENSGPILIDAIRDNIIDMVDLALNSNIKIILCTVLPANHFNWNHEIKPADKVFVLNKMIKTYASNNQIPYVDYYTYMVDENNGLQNKFGKDGVHPNLEGYKVMEKILALFLK